MAETSCDICKIDIDHKIQIEKICTEYKHDLSSHSFVSLYLWRKAMDLSVLLEKDYFAVKCGINGDNSWFFPCGAEKGAYEFIKSNIDDERFSLCYLREKDAVWLNDKFPDVWNFIRDEASDEYIYDISEYISLVGSKFSGIRKKLRKLEKAYKITAEAISDSNADDAVSVVSRWNTVSHNIGRKNLTDEGVPEAALAKRKLFNLRGVIIYSDGTPVSVFAGFPINADTIDILIGKCVPDAPSGTVYYAMRECLKLFEGEYTYCNGEEDLGIPGIRQLKNNLCPIAKTPIWEAALKC